MRRAHAPLLTCALACAVTACTGAGNPNQPLPPGGTAGSGMVSPPSGDVVVTIDMPVADQEFGASTLVDVVAHAAVQNGTDFVDGTSVRVTVTRAGSMEVLDSGQLVIESGDTYTGRVSLGELSSGTYTLTVTARSSGGSVGRATVDFRVDAGPVVTITAPVEGRSYKRQLTIEVIASDPFGLAGPPTAMVGNIPVTLEPSGMPDTFRGAVDFDAQTPPLFGEQLLTVAAVNANGKRTEVQLIFFIDNEGPVITETTPAPGWIIGGIVAVSAVVSDGAGVLDSSVIAIIGDETGTPLFELPLKPRGVGLYGVLFDTARLTGCKEPPSTELCVVFPTVSFRASDQVGNETVVGYSFSVDNIAPIADLDPPNLRDTKLDRVLRCSHEFNPLGNDSYYGDMPNDGRMVPQVFDLRARIQDDGNRAAGLKLPPISLVDPNATSIYVLDDETQALVVDTDGDGTCDGINPLLVPTTQPPTENNQVLKIRLGPVPPAGTGDFTPESGFSASYCESGIDPTRPEPLCTFLQPHIAISYAFGVPAVWSVEPINSLRCQGNQFDALANHIGEGWACIAVGTKDNAGNVSVSAPLRVYIKYDYDKLARPNLGTSFGAAPPAGAGTPPPCTGRFDTASGAVTPGTCSARGFANGRDVASGRGYLCYRGDC